MAGLLSDRPRRRRAGPHGVRHEHADGLAERGVVAGVVGQGVTALDRRDGLERRHLRQRGPGHFANSILFLPATIMQARYSAGGRIALARLELGAVSWIAAN